MYLSNSINNSVAIAIVYFSYTHYSTIKTSLLFNDAKTKKIENQIKLIVDISFLFSVFLFGNWIVHFLLTTFTKGENCPFTNAVRRNLNNSFEHFVIFMGIFSYCLISVNGKNDLNLVGYKKKEFVLLANWFVISRGLYGVLSLIDAKFHLYLKELGSGLGFLAIIAMLSSLAGYSLFDHI